MLGIAASIGDIVAMAQENIGQAAPGFEFRHQRVGPARRIHHDISSPPPDQIGMRTERAARVIAQAIDPGMSSWGNKFWGAAFLVSVWIEAVGHSSRARHAILSS